MSSLEGELAPKTELSAYHQGDQPPISDDASIIIAALLRRLGGRVEITEEEVETTPVQAIMWSHNYLNDSVEIWVRDQ